MTPAQRWDEAVEKIQKERAAFLASVEGLSQGQLDFKPADGGWSVGEVAHHVGLTEKVLGGYVADLLQKGTPEKGASRTIRFEELPMGPQIIPSSLLRRAPILMPFSITSSLMPRALTSYLLANPLVKIKTAPLVEPKPGIPRAELLAFLHDLRQSTLKMLEPVKEWDLSRFRWFHPLMGGHDVYGTLELLGNHDRRHLGQAQRVQKDPKFPLPSEPRQ